jgi:predicted secreted protein
MANEKDGRGFYLIIDNNYFANEQGFTNNETTDSLETTHKHTPNKRKTFITGESTGTITANGMYGLTDGAGFSGYETLKAKQLAGEEVNYEIGLMEAGGKVEAGTAIITDIKLTANRNEPATYDISLQKTGAYTVNDYSS